MRCIAHQGQYGAFSEVTCQWSAVYHSFEW